MNQESIDDEQQQQQPSSSSSSDGVNPSLSSSNEHGEEASINYDPDEHKPDEEGMELANMFSQLLQSRNVSKVEDLREDDITVYLENPIDIDDDDDDDDDVNPNDAMYDESITQAEYEAEYDGVESNISDDELSQDLDNNLKERMLSSPQALVDLNLDLDMDLEDLEEGNAYQVPTVVPDSNLSAGEVVKLVIMALRNNDVPTKNKGIEIFFGYASPVSQVRKEIDKGMTTQQYKDFLLFSKDYATLFDNDDLLIERGDVNYKSKKAYFTVRLVHLDRRAPDVSVNFILSTTGGEEDACWMIDSMLIRPSLRRNRRGRRWDWRMFIAADCSFGG